MREVFFRQKPLFRQAAHFATIGGPLAKEGFPVLRRRIADFLVYVVVRVLICMVQAMRIETGQRLARKLAWLFCDVLRVRGEVVDDNLMHAFPEMSAAQRRRSGPADVGAFVPVGARSGPRAAKDSRNQLARVRTSEERRRVGACPAG